MHEFMHIFLKHANFHATYGDDLFNGILLVRYIAIYASNSLCTEALILVECVKCHTL